MRHPLPSDEIRRIAASVGPELLALLDAAKDRIADARNGDWTTEARKVAIEAIDAVLYDEIKKNLPGAKKTEQGDGMGSMI